MVAAVEGKGEVTMPKILMSYPEGAFAEGAIDSLAEEITNGAPSIEKLPDTPYVRSNIWIYAREFSSGRVYHGGTSGGTKVIMFEVNVIEGGLDAEAKKQMIAFLTNAVRKYVPIPPEERAPVFVLIRDVPAESWGMFGKQVSLDALRNPSDDAIPI
jgi:phenylpyruvate tautomerase PptA (4-oxalocrotonate tautomerase family)